IWDIVELEIEEYGQSQFGDLPHPSGSVRREELQPQLHPAGMLADGAGQLDRPVEFGRVECDEDRLHAAGMPSSAGAGSATATLWRSIPSIRRRSDQIRARITSQVGKKPIRKTISISTGTLMSAWMSFHRFKVTSVQLLLANRATSMARRTQNRVERNRMDAAFRRAV